MRFIHKNPEIIDIITAKLIDITSLFIRYVLDKNRLINDKIGIRMSIIVPALLGNPLIVLINRNAIHDTYTKISITVFISKFVNRYCHFLLRTLSIISLEHRLDKVRKRQIS